MPRRPAATPLPLLPDLTPTAARGMPTPAAGLDEAGRGCLAGPVVAAAVILPERYDLPGLDDSKACPAAARERLSPAIRACALAWGLGVVWPPRIDRINILQASLEAMCRAVGCLRLSPVRLLIDGNQALPPATLDHWWRKRHEGAPPPQSAIVGGDARIPAIAAASIVAKVFRDRLMARLDRRWPGYGFARHKGYGTREHLEALRRLGPCPLHRRTFRGVLPQRPAPAQERLF